jgi:phosphoglycolate phosphatase-like HAD superfamily hydrolase
VNCLLLFDIDNTLLKNSTSHRRAIHYGLSTVYKTDADVESINPHGMTDKQILTEILRKNGLSTQKIEEKMERCIELINRSFFQFVPEEELVVLTGVRELIVELWNKNLLLGLVTGNLEPIAWEKLRRTGLRRYFKIGGFGSDDIRRSALVKTAILRARENAGFSPEGKVFLIGDTPRDIEAGREAGVCTIGVATGTFTQEELHNAGADNLLGGFLPTRNFMKVIGA